MNLVSCHIEPGSEDWGMETMDDTPCQENDVDCGAYVGLFMDFIASRRSFDTFPAPEDVRKQFDTLCVER